jgi:hypothetical protein
MLERKIGKIVKFLIALQFLSGTAILITVWKIQRKTTRENPLSNGSIPPNGTSTQV